MGFGRLGLLLLVAALAVGCSSTPATGPDGGAGDARVDATGPIRDADGDGISDGDEGRSDNIDTDGDGTPDFRDDDSDGDGIPDSTEGGNPGGAPVDSDLDGTPDFRDVDADGNGIPDATEGLGDADGDGLADYRDTDDDGDSVLDADEVGDPAAPVDYDGDGLPDFRDTDSDDDTIGDRDEGVADTDMDGTLDRHDLDSDGDGIPDSEEAGDADLLTPPVDTDGDLAPDFRDTDSDADGLSDEDESAAGTSPTNADSDGDGVSDLVEVGAGTDPLDGTDDPRARGDFVFLMPYMAPATPERDTLDFATNIQNADVYFLMDTTGSMGSSITSLRGGIASLIPMIRAVIPNTWFGLGEFRDYPTSPYGGGSDRPYANFQDLTDDTAAAISATSRYTPSGGADGAESHIPALSAVATGNALATGGGGVPARGDCPAGRFGWPCWREGAVPIVILITDIFMHNGPGGANPYSFAAPAFDATMAELVARNIKVIGIGQGSGGVAHLNAVATATGTVDAGGSPLVSTGGLSAAVLAQIQTLANQTQFDISTEFRDDAADAVDTRTAFVDFIEANTAGDAGRGCEPRAAEDTDGDTHPDTFRAVTSGTRVCFDIVVKQNDTVPPTTDPQLFRATVAVIGDGFTELDSRDIFFLVPPEIEPPGGPI